MTGQLSREPRLLGCNAVMVCASGRRAIRPHKILNLLRNPGKFFRCCQLIVHLICRSDLSVLA